MSGFEVVGVVLAVPGLIQLVKHIYATVQEGRGVSKEVCERIEQIHAELEKMKLLMDKNQSYQEEQAVQATLRDLHHELKQISEECDRKYGLIDPYSRNLKTELHLRTDSRIVSLDRKFDKDAANRKNIEDGIVELNMSFHRFLDECHRKPYSGLNSTLICQEQETFSKSEASPDWQYFRSKFSSLLSALEANFPIAPYHERPFHDGETVLDFEKRTVSIDDAIRTSLNILDNIQGAVSSSKGLEPTLLLSNLRKISRYLICLHQYQESLALHRRILPLLRMLRPHPGSMLTYDLVSFLGSMALLLGLSGSFGEARGTCAEAVQWAESLSVKEPHPLLGLVLRISSAFEPELQKGVELRLKAVSTYRRLSSLYPLYSNYLASTLSSLGRALMLIQQYDSALHSLKEAAKIFESLEPPPDDQLAVSLTRLAQAYKAKGQERKAEEVIERATNLIGRQTDSITFFSASWKPQILSEINRVRAGEIVPSSLRVGGVSFSDRITLQHFHVVTPEKKFFSPNKIATIEENTLIKQGRALQSSPLVSGQPLPLDPSELPVSVYPPGHILAGQPISTFTGSGVEAVITAQSSHWATTPVVVIPNMRTLHTWKTTYQSSASSRSSLEAPESETIHSSPEINMSKVLPEVQAKVAAWRAKAQTGSQLTKEADAEERVRHDAKVPSKQHLPLDAPMLDFIVRSVADMMRELDESLSGDSRDPSPHRPPTPPVKFAPLPGVTTTRAPPRTVEDMMRELDESLSGDSRDPSPHRPPTPPVKFAPPPGVTTTRAPPRSVGDMMRELDETISEGSGGSSPLPPPHVPRPKIMVLPGGSGIGDNDVAPQRRGRVHWADEA